MILKIKGHKKNTIHKLLKYVIKGMRDPLKDMMIAHNLPSFDILENTQAYLKNDTWRKKGSGKIKWTHEYMSFSPKNSEHLSSEKLEVIAREYIDRRNPNALCFSVAHLDKAHFHLHFVFSATEYKSTKNLRMSKKQFNALRYGMERWQKETFPELIHSIVFDGKEKSIDTNKKWGRAASLERQYQAKKRLGETMTEKEILSKTLAEIFSKSRRTEEFLRGIKNAGIEIYMRNGKVAGVVGKRKYRFKGLGVTKDMFSSLERSTQRRRKIERLERDEEKER